MRKSCYFHIHVEQVNIEFVIVSYCELFSISCTKFERILFEHPKECSAIFEFEKRILRSIENNKNTDSFTKYDINDPLLVNEEIITPIKKKTKKEKKNPEKQMFHCAPLFIELRKRYLMVNSVISKYDKIKMKYFNQQVIKNDIFFKKESTIFLKGVINPYSSVHLIWDFILFILIIYK